jgi:hypothetical protein
MIIQGMYRRFIVLVGLLSLTAYADGPATQPTPTTDPTMNWLLSQATTAPATQPVDVPATEPSVLFSKGMRDDSRPGSLTLSNGLVVQGWLSTTLKQPFRVWDDDNKVYNDVPFSLIQSIKASVVWERDEQEWKFAASGSDVKEYSGKIYPARQTDYEFTLKDGTTVTGAVVGPIYVENPDGIKIYVLHKRDKGEDGQALKDLVYVKSVAFSD